MRLWTSPDATVVDIPSGRGGTRIRLQAGGPPAVEALDQMITGRARDPFGAISAAGRDSGLRATPGLIAAVELDEGEVAALIEVRKGSIYLVRGAPPEAGRQWSDASPIGSQKPIKAAWPRGILWSESPPRSRARRPVPRPGFFTLAANAYGIAAACVHTGLVYVVRSGATPDFVLQVPTAEDARLTALPTREGVLVTLVLGGRGSAAIHYDERGREIGRRGGFGVAPPILLAGDRVLWFDHGDDDQLSLLALPSLSPIGPRLPLGFRAIDTACTSSGLAFAVAGDTRLALGRLGPQGLIVDGTIDLLALVRSARLRDIAPAMAEPPPILEAPPRPTQNDPEARELALAIDLRALADDLFADTPPPPAAARPPVDLSAPKVLSEPAAAPLIAAPPIAAPPIAAPPIAAPPIAAPLGPPSPDPPLALAGADDLSALAALVNQLRAPRADEALPAPAPSEAPPHHADPSLADEPPASPHNSMEHGAVDPRWAAEGPTPLPTDEASYDTDEGSALEPASASEEPSSAAPVDAAIDALALTAEPREAREAPLEPLASVDARPDPLTAPAPHEPADSTHAPPSSEPPAHDLAAPASPPPEPAVTTLAPPDHDLAAPASSPPEPAAPSRETPDIAPVIAAEALIAAAPPAAAPTPPAGPPPAPTEAPAAAPSPETLPLAPAAAQAPHNATALLAHGLPTAPPDAHDDPRPTTPAAAPSTPPPTTPGHQPATIDAAQTTDLEAIEVVNLDEVEEVDVPIPRPRPPTKSGTHRAPPPPPPPRIRDEPPSLALGVLAEGAVVRWQATVGDDFELVLSLRSAGGPGRGVRLTASGEALTRGLVSLTRLTVADAGASIPRAEAGMTSVELRDLEIPAGLVHPFDPPPPSPEALAVAESVLASTHRDFRLRGRGLRPGSGLLALSITVLGSSAPPLRWIRPIAVTPAS